MECSLETLLKYEQPTKYIVASEEYSDEYPIPVLTAGKSFILGYTNEENGICRASISPVIIYDDFTTDSKYVDFDFKVKSSAMKILHQINKEDNLRYLFYVVSYLKYTPFSHKRTWISDFSKLRIKYRLPIEQNAIVSELDKIQAALDNKKEQLKKLDELIQSRFYEMFGDIVTNNKEWPIEKLEDVGSFARGVSKHRPRNAPELLGGTMPLIQTGDIANAGMYITTYSATYSDLGVLQSKVWPAGTLCITIAANIGKCSILTFDACFPDSVVGYTIKQNKIKNEYVYYLFGELQAILEANALGVAQKNINLKTLNSLEVPLPPLPLQQAFAAYVEKVEQAKAIVNQEIAHLQELLNSRMDFYFRK